MYRFITASLAFAASVYAGPTHVLEARDQTDPAAVCGEMDAGEGDCRFIITTGLGLTIGGPPAGAPIPVPGVGWTTSDPMGYIFDHDCNLLEAKAWERGAAGDRGWGVEFIENDYHDYIHAFEWGLGIDDIPQPDMNTHLANPLVPICGPTKSHQNGLDAGWYKVCVFHCTGGLQHTG